MKEVTPAGFQALTLGWRRGGVTESGRVNGRAGRGDGSGPGLPKKDAMQLQLHNATSAHALHMRWYCESSSPYTPHCVSRRCAREVQRGRASTPSGLSLPWSPAWTRSSAASASQLSTRPTPRQPPASRCLHRIDPNAPVGPVSWPPSAHPARALRAFVLRRCRLRRAPRHLQRRRPRARPRVLRRPLAGVLVMLLHELRRAPVRPRLERAREQGRA